MKLDLNLSEDAADKKPKAKGKKKPVVSSEPAVEASAAIEMAIAGALPASPAAQPGVIQLMPTQQMVQELLDGLVDTQRSLLSLVVSESHNDTFCQNFHRIMESAKALDTLYRITGTDSLHVNLLLVNLTDSWSEYQEALEIQNAYLEDLLNTEPEGGVEDEDESEEDQEDFNVDDEDDDFEPAPEYALDLDDRFLTAGNTYVARDVDCIAFRTPLDGNDHIEILATWIAELRKRNENNRDFALFAPGFGEGVLNYIASPEVQGYSRVVPITVTGNLDDFLVAESMLALAPPYFDMYERSRLNMRHHDRLMLSKTESEDEDGEELALLYAMDEVANEEAAFNDVTFPQTGRTSSADSEFADDAGEDAGLPISNKSDDNEDPDAADFATSA